MKNKLLLAGLLISMGTFAQTAEQREEIKKSIDPTEIQNLKVSFDAKYKEQQRKIQLYLERNANAKKRFEKDGNIYQIQRIDDDGKPVYINTKDKNQVDKSKASSLYQGGSIGVNITGTNMIAGVWDGGQVNANHELLLGQATMQPTQTLSTAKGNDHMQAVTGIMVGKILLDGSAGRYAASAPPITTNPDGATARGIAPNATTQNYDWEDDISEMTTFAANGFLISNHSYGNSNDYTTPLWLFGAYDSTAKEWDALLKATPNYLPFVAVGNEQSPTGLYPVNSPPQSSDGKHTNGNFAKGGFDMITGSSASKNVMTVGAVNLDNGMSDYSNWGPADDGRVKPDMVTLGTAINAPLYTGNNNYTGVDVSSSGTSYSAPAAAAAGLLLQQYYYSLFNKYMTAASLKAVMLHTADDAGNPGPDAKFGWGILNVEKAAQTIKQMQTGGSAKLQEFTTNPPNDSSAENSLFGTLGGGPARASICWTDDDGTEQTSANGVDNTTSRLVYNFDMLFRQSSPFIDTRPFAKLNIANPNAVATLSTAWFTSNSVDNYKQANIASATANSNYFCYIRKSSSSPTTVRPFSILVTGLKITNPNLAVNDITKNETTLFYNKVENKLKMISNENAGFGAYKIFDMSGKLLQSGVENGNEIAVQNASNGIYILVYTQNGVNQSFKFKN